MKPQLVTAWIGLLWITFERYSGDTARKESCINFIFISDPTSSFLYVVETFHNIFILNCSSQFMLVPDLDTATGRDRKTLNYDGQFSAVLRFIN